MHFKKNVVPVEPRWLKPGYFDLYWWYFVSITAYTVDTCQINYMYLHNFQF